MLQKIRGVRQDDASRTRDGFQDDFFDLFIWYGPSGAVVARSAETRHGSARFIALEIARADAGLRTGAKAP